MTVEREWVSGPAGPLMAYRYRPTNSTACTPAVFIHPVNTGAAVWESVVSVLADERPCFSIDLRGHGMSTDIGPFAASDYAADVLSLLNHFELARVHLVGGSIGGPVSALLAVSEPERVASIASLGGALTLHLTPEVLANLAETLRSGVRALFEKLIPDALGARYRSHDLVRLAVDIATGSNRPEELVYEIIKQAFATDVSHSAGKCSAPSLIINGSDDRACTVADGQRMARALGGEFVALEGVGHLPMLETPGEVVTLLRRHFRSGDG